MAKKVTTVRQIETVLKPYEVMLLLNPDLLESALKKKLKEITTLIEEAGGQITLEDIWGKRDLAYKVKGNTEGIYVVYHMQIPQTFLKELNEVLRIEKEVLRSLITLVPKGYEYTRYDMDTPVVTESKSAPRRSSAPKAKATKKSDEDSKKIDKKLDSALKGDDINL